MSQSFSGILVGLFETLESGLPRLLQLVLREGLASEQFARFLLIQSLEATASR